MNKGFYEDSITCAIIRGLKHHAEYQTLPASIVHFIEEEVLDYFCSKIGCTILNSDPNVQDALMKLWAEIKQ